jgi:hypothetical protein
VIQLSSDARAKTSVIFDCVTQEQSYIALVDDHHEHHVEVQVARQ